MKMEVGEVGGFVVAALLGCDQLPVQLVEPREVARRQQRRRLLGGEPLEQHPHLAQLLVARQRQLCDRDGVARTHLESALAHELHDRLAHGRLADPHRGGDLVDA
jgi:hypothetical protein